MPVAGLPALREAVAENLRRDNGIPVRPTTSSSPTAGREALYLLMQTLLRPWRRNPGARPATRAMTRAIHQAGARMVLVPTYRRTTSTCAAEVEAAITPKTKAILIISPAIQPTSAVVSPANPDRHCRDFTAAHLVVISDEIYGSMSTPAEQISVAGLPGMFERTVTLGGFSKTYAMTGWRVGVCGRAGGSHHHANGGQGSDDRPALYRQPVHCALAATGPQDVVAEYREIYRQRVELMKHRSGRSRLQLWRAAGRSVHQTPCRAASGLRAFLPAAAGARADLPRHGLLAKWVDWLRISVLQPEDQLALALERMAGVLASTAESLFGKSHS